MRDKPSGLAHIFQPFAILNLDTETLTFVIQQIFVKCCSVPEKSQDPFGGKWWKLNLYLKNMQVRSKDAGFFPRATRPQDGQGCCRPRKHWSRDLAWWRLILLCFLLPGCCLSLFLLQTVYFRLVENPTRCLLSFMVCSFWLLCFQAPNSRPSYLAQLEPYLVIMPSVMTTGVGLRKNSPRIRWWGAGERQLSKEVGESWAGNTTYIHDGLVLCWTKMTKPLYL